MSQKIKLIQLQNVFKDTADTLNIPELDNETINQFAENIFNHNHELAEQIITGDIDTVELQRQLKNIASNVESSVFSMDEGKPETEPFWD